MRLRASVISALYNKSLLLKSGIIDGSCNTDVLSLVANDAERYILAANYGEVGVGLFQCARILSSHTLCRNV